MNKLTTLLVVFTITFASQVFGAKTELDKLEDKLEDRREELVKENKKNAEISSLWDQCRALKKKKKEFRDSDKATKKAAKKAYEASIEKVDKILLTMDAEYKELYEKVQNAE